jgi:hypothetical protein
MPCYFLRDGHVAGVEMMPLGLSDEDAIARAHTLSSKRKGRFDGFEVWDNARMIFSYADPDKKPEAGQQWAPVLFHRGVAQAWITE